MEKKEEREWVVLDYKGQKIFGVLHLPVTAEKVPGVLICHGLAGHKTGKYRAYVALAKQLTNRGIAALRFDFRGAGDSEGEFIETTVEGNVEDALLSLDFLSQQKRIDHHRIGIFGRSFGGSVALLAANLFQKVKSIALWAPIFNGDDWSDKWELVHSGRLSDELIRDIMSINGQQASPAFFEEFFKMRIDRALDSLKSIPMLLIHGEKDEIVPVSQVDQFMLHRKDTTVESRYIRLPEGDHHFTRIDDRLVAIDNTVQWFKNTL